VLKVHQSTGAWVREDGSALLDPNGHAIVGWAGNDANPEFNPKRIHGKNNPSAQAIPNIGPLPQGFYTIKWLTAEEAKPYAHLGPNIAMLIPDKGNTMFGRSGFFCHGAAKDLKLRGQESRGCPVLPPVQRQAVKDTGETRLEVVA